MPGRSCPQAITQSDRCFPENAELGAVNRVGDTKLAGRGQQILGTCTGQA
ncbi:MAG TPA: hypothetical protein VMV92_03125 [Streptosporangiaceae bacterium]|nr:hypothetical protein [Streptosporangiaceae bacterium]